MHLLYLAEDRKLQNKRAAGLRGGEVVTSSLQQEAMSVMGNVIFTVFENHQHTVIHVCSSISSIEKRMQEKTRSHAMCFYSPIRLVGV